MGAAGAGGNQAKMGSGLASNGLMNGPVAKEELKKLDIAVDSHPIVE